MESILAGGCRCGAVRYECSAGPLFMGNCHCRDGQRSTGAAYAPMLGVAAEELNISGDVKWYDSLADSGSIASRGFCPQCGARLFAKSSGDPALIEIQAGSLDDPSVFHPVEDISRQCAAMGCDESGAAEVCQTTKL